MSRKEQKYIISEFYKFSADRSVILEAEKKNGPITLVGILQKADTLNRNGRVYPYDILKREAEKYIRDNYNVSAGNYFRKNVDGSDGDDVSDIYSRNGIRDVYSTPDQQVNTDYDKARADHPGFDRMMQRGMQDYLVRGQVNDLVGFLNNPSNDNVFKSQVLNTITNHSKLLE